MAAFCAKITMCFITAGGR